MPSYEYRRATWAEACELGPQGWRLVAIPPVQEVRQVLGQPQLGEPLYAMERETPAPVERHDAAVARAGEAWMAGMSNLGALGAAADDMLQQEDGQPAPPIDRQAELALARAAQLRMAGMSHLGSLGAAADDMLRQGDGQPSAEGLPQ